MSICRKFEGCSAPQCPIDQDSLRSKYYSGDPICLWLLEYAKEDNREQLESAIGDIPIELIAEAYEILIASNGTIKSRLERAKKTGSRLKRNPQANKPSISPIAGGIRNGC